jgi:hypothetical protein
MVEVGALREVQRPLKERYREDPGSAVITLEAQGDLDGEWSVARSPTRRR